MSAFGAEIWGPMALGAAANVAQGLFAKKAKVKRQPTVTDRQAAEKAHFGQRARDIYDNPTQGFDAIAKHSANQFNNTIAPNLAQRFTNHTNADLSSPSFNSIMNWEGQDWKDQLNAQAAQYGLAQQQNANQLLGYSQAPEFENVYEAGRQTPLSNAFGGIGQAANQYGQFQAWNKMFNPSTPDTNPMQPERSATQDVAALMKPLNPGTQNQQSALGAQGQGQYGQGFNPIQQSQYRPQFNVNQNPMSRQQGLAALNNQISGSYGMSPANYQTPYGAGATGNFGSAKPYYDPNAGFWGAGGEFNGLRGLTPTGIGTKQRNAMRAAGL